MPMKVDSAKFFFALLGYGLCWVWIDVFWITNPSIMLTFIPGLFFSSRLLVSIGQLAGVLLLFLLRKVLFSVVGRKPLLFITVFLMSVLLPCYYAGVSGDVNFIAFLPVVAILLGLFFAPSFIAWIEVISLQKQVSFQLVFPSSLLLNGILLLVLLTSMSFLPTSILVLIHCILPWISLTLMQNAERVAHLDPLDEPRQDIPLPKALLFAFFTFPLAFGFLVNFSSSQTGATGSLQSVIGILTAASLFFVTTKLCESNKRPTFPIRIVFVPCMILGFLTLPVIGFQIPQLSCTLAWIGIDYFVLLRGVIIAEIISCTLASPLCVIGKSLAVFTFGIVIGLFMGNVLGSQIRGDSQIYATISMIAVILILCISFWALDERKYSTLWGLNKLPPQEAKRLLMNKNCTKLISKNGLTEREGEIMLLLVGGKRPEQIAEVYTISIATVRTHIQRIYGKLGIHSYKDLAQLLEQSHDA